MEDIPAQREVDEFILRRIDSVPHLEALLLLWTSRPRVWSVDDMAKALYVRTDMAQAILEDLAQRELISDVPNQSGRYIYAVHTSAFADAHGWVITPKEATQLRLHSVMRR